MSLIHLHLLLNHLPTVGIPLAGAIFVWGIVKRERAVQRSALGLLFFLALMTIPIFLTGEPAEAAVKQLPGVANAAIERHESVAKLAIWVTNLLGVVALVGLVMSRRQRSLPRWFAYAGVAATVLAVGVLTPTAYLGGQIRHSEIRAAGTAGSPQEAQQGEPEERPARAAPRDDTR